VFAFGNGTVNRLRDIAAGGNAVAAINYLASASLLWVIYAISAVSACPVLPQYTTCREVC
jgi:hypothetical protein